MPFLLDTNALSDLVRNDPRIQSRLQANASDRIFTSVIVRGELLFGIARLPASKKREALTASVRLILGAITCEPVPVSAADEYASIKAAAERKGAALDENDLWIAATAIHFGAAVVTRDLDYGRIDALSVVDWTV